MDHATGWLFDLYPQGDRMVLWFITDAGERWRLTDPFAPSFYVDAAIGDGGRARDRLLREIDRMKGLAPAGRTERTDFWTGRPRPVEEIRVTNLDLYGENLRRLARRLPQLAYYNCDIPPEIHYGYDRGLFPTARCAIERDGDRLTRCELRDDAQKTDYEPPPLRSARIAAEGELAGRRPRLRSLTYVFDDRSIRWEESASPAQTLLSLRAQLLETDPDLIWTDGGDSTLMAALLELAARCGVEDLALDREAGVRRRLAREGRSYISYGRVLYQAPDYPLFGRWHIDRRNCFWTSEAGLDGLIEVARLSKIPLQRAARRSIGTGISSIQLDRAYREGTLIPWKKSQPEAWKTAERLLAADRGGLVFQPLTGVYEDVAELDFVSMYPTIMVRENVSPETVNCGCCPPRPDVPEIGYTICRRRRGLVSRALAPIIEKRRVYKRLRARWKAAAENDAAARDLYDRYDARQGALKWLLVCCFGYLGYRNARFGRIEAHESTCAFSRERLLQARDLCEARGFRVLHAIVDCVWIQKPGAPEEDLHALCEEIGRATNLPIALEGRYRWIAFLPSRQDPDAPVPNRYFGCFADGSLKYRGIEIRRGDQAPLAQRLQGELLERLRAARTLGECRAMREELLDLVRRTLERLQAREIPVEDLILRRRTSQEADEYRSNDMTAVAARQAARAGLPLHAGESVSFLVIHARDVDPDSRLRLAALLRPEDAYDAEFYAEQARRAAATILEPILGERLELAPARQPPPAPQGQSRKRSPRPPRASQPDLFTPSPPGPARASRPDRARRVS